MRKLRWQLLVVVLALIAIAILLIGQQPTVPLLTGVAEPTPEPVTGGIYIEGLVGSLGRLNPLLDAYNPADRDINSLLFSSLIRFDDRGLPQEDLAEAWAISQDSTAYSFSIRKEAYWHDGEPVVADDILFTIEMMRSEALPVPEDIRQFWNQVDVQVLDERTIHFKLPEAFAPFMDYLAFGVLPVHLLGEVNPEDLIDADFNMQPVGSGPFEFKDMLVEDGQIVGVHLVANQDYYGKRPFLEEIVFEYFPDSAAALEAFRQGQVMGVSQITPVELEDALLEQDLRVYTGRLPRLAMVFFNLDDPQLPFFQEADVRRALLMGINRQWIVDEYLDSQAIVAQGPIFPGTWAYFEGIEQVGYNPEQALELLKDAGYTIPADGGDVRAKDDVYLSFELIYPEEGSYAPIAKSIQDYWKRIGVGVNLKAVPTDELLGDYLQPRKYQAALIDLNFSRSPDPDPYPFWHETQTRNGQNYSQWDDRQASEYLEQARVTDDITERARLYRNFQVRFFDQMPALPLFYPVYSYGVSSEVQGVRIGPLLDPSSRFATVGSWYMQEGVVSAQAPEDSTSSTETPTAAP